MLNQALYAFQPSAVSREPSGKAESTWKVWAENVTAE